MTDARELIREYFAALDGSHDPRATGSTCRLIRAEEACRNYLTDTAQSDAPALAGITEPTAYLHRIEEPDRSPQTLLSRSHDDPWRHWLESHRQKCVYTVTPLYAAHVPDDLLAAARAAIAYDAAIASCANDPEKMASFCT